MRRSIVLLLAGLLPTLAAGPVAYAAVVEITIRDNQGNPLPGIRLALEPLAPVPPGQPGGSIPPRIGPPIRRGVTGSDGKAALADVPVGSYFVNSGLAADRFLIHPSRNPFLTPSVISVLRPEDRVPVELVYWRGDLVTCRLWLNEDAGKGGRVRFTEVATEQQSELVMDPQGYGELVLPPGRWEVEIAPPPPGFLLLSLEQDREQLPGSKALIEVTSGSRVIGLSWKYGAPCRVSGRLSWDIGPDPPARVVATLTRPGAWRATALARGGSSFERVPASMERDGHYELRLPDGVWRLGAEGERIVSGSPEFVDLELAPGDERWVDFTVKVRDEPEQPVLIVAVRSPGGKDLEEASVAIWPIEGGAEGAEPLRRAKTTRSGPGAPSARIIGLPRGSYLITAGHREYAEGKGSLAGYKAEPGERAAKIITLGAGASVRARATDEKGAAVPGVELSLDRTGEPAVSIVKDEELAGKRAHRTKRTDAGGGVTIEGLDAGSYRVTAAPSGSRAQTHLVRLSDGKLPPAESLDLRIGSDQQIDLEVHLVPAGHIRARLICSDRGPVPRSASLRVLPVPLDGGGAQAEDADIGRLALLARDDVMLEGKGPDSLTGGPLPAGSFLFGVRPTGHDRWTWAVGTEELARAVLQVVEEGKSADAGLIELDCGPTIRVRPEIRSGQTVPDLRESSILPVIRRVPPPSPPVGSTPDSTRLPGPAVELAAGRITLRGLREETLQVELTVSHPYFVPGAIHVGPLSLPLERGREAEVKVPIEEIGGAIEVEAGEASGALLTDAAGNSLRIGADRGAVRFNGLRAGLYSVRLCPDAECAGAGRSWTGVAVSPAETTRPR